MHAHRLYEVDREPKWAETYRYNWKGRQNEQNKLSVPKLITTNEKDKQNEQNKHNDVKPAKSKGHSTKEPRTKTGV